MTEPPLYLSRYPAYDVLAKEAEWDDVTRRVIERRVHDVPPYRFFSRREAQALECLADTVLPQDDRPEHARIPLVPWLDERLHARRGSGYRFEEMPADGPFWRQLARALDAEAEEGWHQRFPELHAQEHARLVEALARGEVRARAWEGLPLARTWSLVVTEFATHYYAHPSAWSEIGFGGPKFPRIYARPMRENPGEAEEVGDG